MYKFYIFYSSILIYFGPFVNAGCLRLVRPDLPTFKIVKIKIIEFFIIDFIRASYCSSFAISKPELCYYFSSI